MSVERLPIKGIDDIIEDLILEGPNNLTELIQLQNHKNRIININDVEDYLAQNIVNDIINYNKMDFYVPIDSRLPIKMFINSCGGSLPACYTIIDAIKLSKTPVLTINIGIAYSAGGVILLAGHKRYAFPHSSFLLHEGSNGFAADAGKFKDYSRFYEKQLNDSKDFVIEQTLIDDELYEQRRHTDWWMDAHEMLKYGIIDEILTDFL